MLVWADVDQVRHVVMKTPETPTLLTNKHGGQHAQTEADAQPRNAVAEATAI